MKNSLLHSLGVFAPLREKKNCRTCHGKGFTPGLRELSFWSCPDCGGTGEECGHASPVALNALTGAVRPASEVLP